MVSLVPTFLASLRAVGTAATMALAGFYLHRRQFVTPSGKKMLALISQQVTIPCFLFAKIIYCPQPNNDGEEDITDDGIICPSVANRIGDLWMLLIWPFYVVSCGVLTGYLAAKISGTPNKQVRSCLAACAFGNSTGLVITLLSVIHKQFNNKTELGRIDPTAFLSVYLLLYPVLQWGVGGWLLAPEENTETEKGIITKNDKNENNIPAEGTPLITDSNNNANKHSIQRRPSHISHILNYEPEKMSPSMSATVEEFGGIQKDGGHLVVSSEDRNGQPNWHATGFVKSPSSGALAMIQELSFDFDQGSCEETPLPTQSTNSEVDGDYEPTLTETYSSDSINNLPRVLSLQELAAVQEADILPLTETLQRVLRKVFQPPVIGALLGLFIASFPSIRGVFENIYGEGRTAVLHFIFDGIYSVGQAAVPINMIILGINLSSTFEKTKPKKNDDEVDGNMLPNPTMLAIVVGKMIVMPMIGIVSTWILERYYIDIPDAIDATCYLVMMIVFITPTANNVMVMVELSGSSSKEGMARLIGYQYVVSPVVLSLVLSAVVSLASCHFDQSCSHYVDTH